LFVLARMCSLARLAWLLVVVLLLLRIIGG
jgi:hypothetical protein